MTELNRIHNADNPYQGDAKRVLCVCSAGLLRSPTAANVLHKEYGYNTRAAGISDSFALVVVDPVQVAWAQEVVFMNKDIEQEFSLKFSHKNTQTLNIEDAYGFMDAELVDLITKRYNPSLVTQDSTGDSE